MRWRIAERLIRKLASILQYHILKTLREEFYQIYSTNQRHEASRIDWPMRFHCGGYRDSISHESFFLVSDGAVI